MWLFCLSQVDAELQRALTASPARLARPAARPVQADLACPVQAIFHCDWSIVLTCPVLIGQSAGIGTQQPRRTHTETAVSFSNEQ